MSHLQGLTGSIGNTPLIKIEPFRKNRLHHPWQSGIYESRRVGEGPGCIMDDQRGGKIWCPAARRHSGRGDRGQYRHWTRPRM